jgi:hypothetical protein
MTEIDRERALTNPASEFDRPADVVKSKELSTEEKKKALKEWEVDARLMQVASEENMSGGEPSRLDEVKKAQAKVGGEAACEDADPPTKTGGAVD